MTSLVWEQVVVDARDPAALGQWWLIALGWVVIDDDPRWYEIRARQDKFPGLIFVPVSDPKVGKNRLHLDLRPTDPDAAVRRLVGLGATPADIGQSNVPWTVLADPEGNEFCVLGPA